MEQKNKNIILGTIVVVLLLAVIILPEVLRDSSADRVATDNNPLLAGRVIEDDERAELTYIDYEEFEELLAGEEPKFILVGRPTCIWCHYEQPILENITFLHDVEVHYLDTDKFSQAEAQKLKTLDEDYSRSPTHYIVHSGEIHDILKGGRSYEDLTEFLIKHEFMS